MMSFFARGMFQQLWQATDKLATGATVTGDSRQEAQLRLSVLDRDHDGQVSVDDFHIVLQNLLHVSVHKGDKKLAQKVHAFADITGDGLVTVEDFQFIAMDDPEDWKLPPKWQEAFPDPMRRPSRPNSTIPITITVV